ncbi:hypothetical protein IFR05_016182 [Cadophora sp. M221]|nr:hypothetical protein IFR05_016182 [Cadophora sp. M221]
MEEAHGTTEANRKDIEERPFDIEEQPGGTRCRDHDLLNYNPKCTPEDLKGEGYFAKVDIAGGTCILTDIVTLLVTVWHDDDRIQQILSNAFENQSGGLKQYQAWVDNAEERDKHGDKWQSYFEEYGMPIHSIRSARRDGPGYKETGLFRYMALFQHSCLANAHFSYNPKTLMGSLHAIRDIPKGEKVTISFLPELAYLDDNKRFSARLVLKKTFGRTCFCSLHTAPDAEDYSATVKTMYSLLSPELHGYGSYADHLCLFYYIHQAYCKHDVFDVRRARVLEECMECAISYGDAARAIIFANIAKDRYCVLEGPDGLKVVEMEKYMADVIQHPKFNAHGRHSQSTSQIIRKTEGDQKEGIFDWVWMQGKWARLSPYSAKYKKMAGLDGSIPGLTVVSIANSQQAQPSMSSYLDVLAYYVLKQTQVAA